MVQELKEKEISRLKDQKDAMLKEDARLSSLVDGRLLVQDSLLHIGCMKFTMPHFCISWHQTWPPQPPAVHMFKEKYLEAKVLKARISKLEL